MTASQEGTTSGDKNYRPVLLPESPFLVPKKPSSVQEGSCFLLVYVGGHILGNSCLGLALTAYGFVDSGGVADTHLFTQVRVTVFKL